MARWRVGAVGAALCLAVGTLATAQESPPPKKAWELAIKGGITDLAFSPTEDCLVVATPERVVAVDTSGVASWEVPVTRLGRGAQVGRVAAAPGCKWILIAGTPSSKRAWLVSRASVKPIPTSGTPQGLAVSHDGKIFAVGTAAGALYLADTTGQVVHSWRFESSIIDGLEFSPDDQRLALTAGSPVGVLTVAGGTQWIQDLGGTMATTASWDRFVTWWEPPHFSTLGEVSLVDGQGKARWNRPTHYPSAAIAPDGSYVVLAGVPDDSLGSVGESAEPADNRYLVIGADGAPIAEGATPNGQALAVSLNGERFLLRERAGDGEQLVARTRAGELAWTLALYPYGPLRLTSTWSLFVDVKGDSLIAYR